MKYITGTCWWTAILLAIGIEGGGKADVISFGETILWFLLVFVLIALPFGIGYLRQCVKRLLKKVARK